MFSLFPDVTDLMLDLERPDAAVRRALRPTVRRTVPDRIGSVRRAFGRGLISLGTGLAAEERRARPRDRAAQAR